MIAMRPLAKTQEIEARLKKESQSLTDIVAETTAIFQKTQSEIDWDLMTAPDHASERKTKLDDILNQ